LVEEIKEMKGGKNVFDIMSMKWPTRFRFRVLGFDLGILQTKGYDYITK
jgi:hypothetical protein